MSNELARAQRIHADATAELTAASEQTLTNADRVSDTQALMQAITSRRLDGKATDRDAIELFALNADMAVLQTMLAAAQQAQAQARDQVQQALQALNTAQAEHDRGLAQIKFDAIHQQVKAIEEVFCQALGELGRAGQAIGRLTFSSCYSKGDTLHRALDLNVIPPKA